MEEDVWRSEEKVFSVVESVEEEDKEHGMRKRLNWTCWGTRDGGRVELTLNEVDQGRQTREEEREDEEGEGDPGCKGVEREGHGGLATKGGRANEGRER